MFIKYQNTNKFIVAAATSVNVLTAEAGHTIAETIHFPVSFPSPITGNAYLYQANDPRFFFVQDAGIVSAGALQYLITIKAAKAAGTLNLGLTLGSRANATGIKAEVYTAIDRISAAGA